MQPTKSGFLAVVSMLSLGVGSAQDRTVVLGGTGQSPYIEQAIDGISDALKSAGVKVRILSGDARTRTALLAEMKPQGYNNLLYVTLDRPLDTPADSSRGSVVAACFVDGAKLWEEKSKGPLALPMGTEHEVGSMVTGMMKKLGKRAGGPCFPK